MLLYRKIAHSICNLTYKAQREIPVVIHNGSNYDYHFIIKELAEEFKDKLECLGENTEKYITFSVPIKKENDDDDEKIITYKLKFIDSYIFMDRKLLTYQKLIIKIVKNAWKEIKLNQNANLFGLKIVD